MKIILDAMGGDHAPLAVLQGASLALRERKDLDVVLVGDEAKIKECAEENSISVCNFEIVHTPCYVTMEDSPMCVVRDKADSSMGRGLRLLSKGEADAFVSAGNTGALLVGASLIVRRIKGVSRPGIASVLPLSKPILLLDSGANLVVTDENMEDFALMGTVYMKKLYGVDSPRVGQFNNGSEHNKGLPLQIATYQRLMACEYVNFVGNIEGKDVPFGVCDVLIADGFTGNAVLKVSEGMGKFMMQNLKALFKGPFAKIFAFLFLRRKIKNMKRAYSASEHGGAPILGVKKPVIKAHGSSDAVAVKNAILQAVRFCQTGVNEEIACTVSRIRESKRIASTAAAILPDETLSETERLLARDETDVHKEK